MRIIGLNALFLAVAVLLSGPIQAQDTGIPDTVRLVCGDWNILSEADSLFSVELWAWTDTLLGGVSLPFEVRFDYTNFPGWEDRVGVNAYKYDGNDLYFFVSELDSSFSIDTFIYDQGLPVSIKTLSTSVLDPALDPTAKNWGFNGFLLGLIVAIAPDSVLPRRVSTKIGDLYIKIDLSQGDIMPNAFPLLIKPIRSPLFYPPTSRFRFKPFTGDGFAPVFAADTIQVTSVPPWDAGEVGGRDPAIPKSYDLAQNYPNPFNPKTTIAFYIGSRQYVSLSIYNILGKRVRELVGSELEPGWQEVIWDGTGSEGERVPSGIYFYRLSAGDFSETRKMLLLK